MAQMIVLSKKVNFLALNSAQECGGRRKIGEECKGAKGGAPV